MSRTAQRPTARGRRCPLHLRAAGAVLLGFGSGCLAPWWPASPVDQGVIETSLNNVTFETFNSKNLTRKGGGIWARGGMLLGVDRRGKFFLFRMGEDVFHELDIEIDTRIEVFNRYAEERDIDAGHQRFRVHDLIFDDKRNSLMVSHHHWNSEKECLTIRISALDVGPDHDFLALRRTADDWRLLYETKPCLTLPAREWSAWHRCGGRMALRGPDELIVTIGDHHLDGSEGGELHPQDPESDYGKVLSLDLATSGKKLVSVGHRNPQGLVIDRRGQIWITEHGPQGGDELNLVVSGGNYGWPLVTYGRKEDGQRWPLSKDHGRHDDYELPVFAWVPSIGVSNLLQVRGFAPEWDGDLLVSSLKEGTLFRIRVKDGRAVYSEPIVIGKRIRDIDQFDDGTIVLWTDDADLIELRLEKLPDAPRKIPLQSSAGS